MAEPLNINDQHLLAFDVTGTPSVVCRCGWETTKPNVTELFLAAQMHKLAAFDDAEAQVEAEYERQREAGLL